jgi:thiol-disulfide isomerase/thioredoxin
MNEPVNQKADSGTGHTQLGIWVAAIAFFGGIAMLLAIWSRSDNPSTANSAPPAFRGEVREFIPSSDPRPAPQTAFTTGEGQPTTLADARGRVLLVNFWATWCVPCVQEMGSLDRVQGALGVEGLTVLAISQDRNGIDAVRPFYDKLGLANLGVYLDPKGTVAREFKVEALPVSVIIDRDGREVGRLVGPAEWDSQQAVTLLRHYLESH